MKNLESNKKVAENWIEYPRHVDFGFVPVDEESIITKVIKNKHRE